ncbi:DUF5677 domain-containing protein [Glutamicibacter sp. 2E12]|uniref:DUF5677 domain-containing protein n=1 Tax=Glutamicibacter sp. 2E12 TaxID=3416181 RepID=UPI003CF25365
MSQNSKQRQKRKNASGESFGIPKQDWTTADKTGREMPDMFTAAGKLDGLPEAMLNEVLDFPSAVSHLVVSIYSELENHAQKLILTAAVNDIVSLVTRAYALDGRSAAYSARALFEHLINFHDVCDSTVNTPDRYTYHKYITQKRVAEHRGALELLSDREQKRERKRLDKLAESTRNKAAVALDKYGNEFSRQWAQGSLFNRAKLYDAEDGYDGYRILSSVIHGSSGAMSGVTRIIDGRQIHRTGPDLELASLAWIEGLTAFYRITEVLAERTGLWEAEDLRERTGHLVLFWSEIRAELRRLDERLWPKRAPREAVAVVAFHPGGRHRWYLYNPDEESLTLAEPPAVEPDLSGLDEAISTYSPEEFNGRPLTAIHAGVKVRPLRGQLPFPASSIMVPEGHPSRNTGHIKRLRP